MSAYAFNSSVLLYSESASPVQKHQRYRGHEQTETTAGTSSRRLSEEERDGQDAAGKGQTGQTRQKGEREEAYTER